MKTFQIFTSDEINQIQEKLLTATWVDGKKTADGVAKEVKNNRQLERNDPIGIELGNLIQAKLSQIPAFLSYTLPNAYSVIGFNRYEQGENYGAHIDNVFSVARNGRIRSDLSATLFLSDDYEGGELVFEDKAVKLKAGEVAVYSSGKLHAVQPVTKGIRLAAFFWIQSAIKDEGQRELLFQLDKYIQGNQSSELVGIYHNLVRMWH